MPWKQNQVPSGYHGTHKNEMRDVIGRHLFHFLKCPIAHFRGEKTFQVKCPPIKPKKIEATLL
jgi:hypothetical protein